jgi:hypothetical protein
MRLYIIRPNLKETQRNELYKPKKTLGQPFWVAHNNLRERDRQTDRQKEGGGVERGSEKDNSFSVGF